MNIIFETYGGIGKIIMSTVIIKKLKQKHPESNIMVVTSHPLVFKNNPHVKHIYSPDQKPAINGLYINGNRDVKILMREPYAESDFLLNKKHLLETWSDLYDLDYNNELPEFYLDSSEIEQYKKSYNTDKPIMVIHPNGGYIVEFGYNWARDLPPEDVQEIINQNKDKYTIYHIRSKDQKLKYDNVIEETGNVRKVAVLLTLAEKILSIDTFTQHLAAALRKKATVCWVVTKPKVFGYNFHNNIISNKPEFYTPSNQYFGYNFLEPIENLPYQDPSRIFDVEKITNELNK